MVLTNAEKQLVKSIRNDVENNYIVDICPTCKYMLESGLSCSLMQLYNAHVSFDRCPFHVAYVNDTSHKQAKFLKKFFDTYVHNCYKESIE